MAKQQLKGKKARGLFKYINDTEELLKMKSQATCVAEFVTLDHLELAMSINAAYQL